MSKKYCYLFTEGNAKMRELLGGKGANLAEMTNIGLPVPQGFTITTEACTQYYEDGRQINDAIMAEIMEYIEKMEKITGSAEPAVLPHQHRETIAEKGEVHKDGVPRLPLKTADIFQRDGHPALLVYVSHPEFRDIVPHQCPPFPEFADKVVIPGDGMERKRRFHAVPPHSCQNSETGPSHTPLTRPAGLLQNGQFA